MKPVLYFIAITFLCGINLTLYCQEEPARLVKEKFNINRQAEDDIGYAQAVKVGNTIYVSGSVGWGEMKEALKMAYDNINKTLSAYNVGFANVVKENLYTTSLDSAIKYKNIRLLYYGNDFPAATWVEVKRLYNPGLVVEIEVIAMLPEQKDQGE